LELESNPRIELSNWTQPLEPKTMGIVDLSTPSGKITIEPKGYCVIGINVKLDEMLTDIKAERAKMNWPPVKTNE
jgi:hypothetical protein